MSIVAVLQPQNRAPLTWDEGSRVRAGQEFVFAVHGGDLSAIWNWANEQAFYPLVAPLLNGLVLLFTDDPLLAAWVPSVLAYGAVALLAAALATELGFKSSAAWTAAVLCWATPLYARLAAGAFVDTLGACACTASVLLIVRSLRTSRLQDLALAAVLCTVSFLTRYDFGIVILGALGIASAAAFGRQSRQFLPQLTMITFSAFALMGLWFIPNATLKIPQFITFFYNGGTGKSWTDLLGVGLDRWTYYVAALFNDQELGLSNLVADAVVIGVAWGGVVLVRSQPRGVVLPAFVGVWYIFFSLAGGRSPQFSRYMAQVLPFAFVFVGIVIARMESQLRLIWTRTRGLMSLGSFAVLICGIELLRQLAGPSGIQQQYWFIRNDQSASAVLDFIRTNLPTTDSSLLFIGETNEVGPDLIRLTWMRMAGRPGQRVILADQLPDDARRGRLYAWLQREGVPEVIAVRIGTGARFDYQESRDRSSREGGYDTYAPELDGSGHFTPLASLMLEDGRLQVKAWRVELDADGPR